LLLLERAAARRAPLCIALDDLHWADSSTRNALAYLVHNLVATPIVVVGTYRRDELRLGDPLGELLVELDRLPNVERLELEPLSDAQVAELVRLLLGSERDTELPEGMVARASGNPFHAEELAISMLAGQPSRSPPSVRAMVESRLGRLDSQAREMAEMAAVAGGPAPLELLARAAGLPDAAAAAALRAGVDGYLLVSSADAAMEREQVDTRHVLTRESILATMGPSERRRLHAAMAHALQRDPSLGGPTELEQAARRANHELGAGDVIAAIPTLRWAAGAAERALAHAEADRFYWQLLQLVDEHGVVPVDEIDRSAILERAAESAHLAGNHARAIDLATRALASQPALQPLTVGQPQAGGPASVAVGGARPARAQSARDRDQSVRLRVRLAGYLAAAGRASEALEVQRQLLDEGPPPRTQLRILLGQTRALLQLGRRADAVATASRAVALGATLGSKHDLSEAQRVLGISLAIAGRTQEALEALNEAQQLDRSARGAPRTRIRPSRYPDMLRGYLDSAAILDQAGDPRSAASQALAGSEEAGRLGLGATWGLVLAASAARDLLCLGRWDEAERLTTAVRPGSAGDPWEAHAVRARLATLTGRFDMAEAHLAALDDPRSSAPHAVGWPTYGAFVAAELAWWRRQYGLARDAVIRGLGIAAETSDDVGALELAALGVRVAADEAGLSRATRARAGGVPAEEFAMGCWARLASARSDGIAHRYQALAASADAELSRLRGTSDPSAWRAMVERWDAVGDPFEAACARWRQAEAMLSTAATKALAEPVLREALDVAGRLGAVPLASEIESLARRARLTTKSPEVAAPELAPAADTTARERALERGLSQREVDVLELLANGATDREIADRLFITEKTASHHVSHILTKLAVNRRGEAGAIAHRLGLGDG
jgi:DNA-binding CsgD family transcriptional regulator/tetratricopeptide (TPR) repeat protein